MLYQLHGNRCGAPDEDGAGAAKGAKNSARAHRTGRQHRDLDKEAKETSRSSSSSALVIQSLCETLHLGSRCVLQHGACAYEQSRSFHLQGAVALSVMQPLRTRRRHQKTFARQHPHSSGIFPIRPACKNARLPLSIDSTDNSIDIGARKLESASAGVAIKSSRPPRSPRPRSESPRRCPSPRPKGRG